MVSYRKHVFIQSLLNYWLFISLILIVLSLFIQLGIRDVRGELTIINLAILFSVYGIINLYLHYSFLDHRATSAIFVIIAYSILLTLILNVLYYHYTGTYLEFSTKDSTEYDLAARELIQYSIVDSIKIYFTNGRDSSDFGAVFTTSLAYRIHPSPFTYNIINVILGSFTVVMVYKLTSLLLDHSYALLCTMTYGLSSFIIYFYSTGMKEVWFLFGVVAFFLSTISFIERKKSIYILTALLTVGFIYFFRPAVLVMLILSTLAAIVVKKSKKTTAITLMVVITIGLAIAFPYVFVYWQLISGRFDPSVIAVKQQLAPTTFNYLVSFLSAAIGPFPSFSPLLGREQQALYSVGLTFRVLLSVFFWCGTVKAFYERNIGLMILAFFSIFEMLSLALILESFELRLSLPHMPAVFALSFYGIYLFENGHFKRVGKYLKHCFVAIALILIFWNLR